MEPVAEKFREICFRGNFWNIFQKKVQIFLGNNGLKVKRKVGTIKGWGTLGAFSIIHLSKFPTPAVTPTFLPLHLLSCKCQNLKHICLNFQMYLSKFENYLMHFLYISKVKKLFVSTSFIASVKISNIFYLIVK